VAGGALVLALKSKLVGSEPSQILSHGTGGSREPFPRTAPAGCELEIGDGGLLGAPGLYGSAFCTYRLFNCHGPRCLTVCTLRAPRRR
jgi:hypothetical protein